MGALKPQERGCSNEVRTENVGLLTRSFRLRIFSTDPSVYPAWLASTIAAVALHGRWVHPDSAL